MEKIQNIKKEFSELRGWYSAIARNSECSEKYVRLVVEGKREPKTGRAEKYRRVIAECELMLRKLRAIHS